MLRLSLCVLAALGGCRRESPSGRALTPDDLLSLGWKMGPPGALSEPCIYSIKVKAMDLELELDGVSGTDIWVAPDGVDTPCFWEEEQSMNGYACPGPSMSASIGIRQPVVAGARREDASSIEIDATYRPYSGDAVVWRHAARIDLSRPQTVTGNGFTVTVDRRPNKPKQPTGAPSGAGG